MHKNTQYKIYRNRQEFASFCAGAVLFALFIHIFLVCFRSYMEYHGLRKNERRPEIQIIPGYQQIVGPVKFSADAVPEAALPVAVGIDNR